MSLSLALVPGWQAWSFLLPKKRSIFFPLASSVHTLSLSLTLMAGKLAQSLLHSKGEMHPFFFRMFCKLIVSFSSPCGWLASPVTSISKKRDASFLPLPVLHTHCLSFWPYLARWLAQSLVLIKREMHLFSLCQFCTPIVSPFGPCDWLASLVTSTSRERDASFLSWLFLHA